MGGGGGTLRIKLKLSITHQFGMPFGCSLLQSLFWREKCLSTIFLSALMRKIDFLISVLTSY